MARLLLSLLLASYSIVLSYGFQPRPFLSSTNRGILTRHSDKASSLRLAGDDNGREAPKATTGGAMSAKIAGLKAEAAKFRAEAAELESVQRAERAKAIEDIFRQFDTNQDGEISVEELREGLNTIFNDKALSSKEAQKLLNAFDDSGDGALQLEEFKSINEFRMKLDELILEEKQAALESQREATEARQAADLAQQKMQELQTLLNDSPPTVSDRVVSLIPYIFPLVDSVQYGKYMLDGNMDSPLVGFVTTMYIIYQSIPFSGLFAFFALSSLSGNMSLNRLIRFNMQQAILVDIALIIPGLLGGLATYCLPTFLNIPISKEMVTTSSTVTFLAVSAVILYSCASSLAGVTPNKVPIISERVEKRVPTAAMFDKEGNYVGRNKKGEKEDDDAAAADKDGDGGV